MDSKGLFISFEGLDGSGKTTQIVMLKEYLQSLGYEVLITREPGGTRISEQIRALLLDPTYTEFSIVTEMLLYAASRAQLVAQVIKPALEAGKVILCDRFIDSTTAYQGYGRNLGPKNTTLLNDIALQSLIPDITFWLDIKPELSLKRRMEQRGLDRIEQEAIQFHYKVYLGYKKIAKKNPQRVKRINALNTIEEMHNEIKELINVVIEQKRMAI